MADTPTSVKLNEFSTQCAIRPQAYAPGTYRVLTRIIADGMVSSLFVDSIDPGATLEVKYWETTTGHAFGERYDLDAHPTVDDSFSFPYTHKICIPKLHSAVRMEVILTGGNATFGVLQSANDISVLDKILAETGEVPVTLEPGTPFHETGTVLAVENSQEKLFDITVAAGKTYKLTQLVGSACEEGKFEAIRQSDSKVLGEVIVTPSNRTFPFKFEPSQPISAGTVIEVFFTAFTNDNSTVRAFLMGNIL